MGSIEVTVVKINADESDSGAIVMKADGTISAPWEQRRKNRRNCDHG